MRLHPVQDGERAYSPHAPKHTQRGIEVPVLLSPS